MEFGLQFFPDVNEAEKPGVRYFAESLELVEMCDAYGYSHVRIVEHYFHRWGGLSPNPIVFLAAASQRTKTARMVTGAPSSPRKTRSTLRAWSVEKPARRLKR